ncbi:hypothetical protein [Actinomadura alba]|uniref:hypothetical protein n=1 Tax=Actinomadura alba TaxID=406431 RepID=UPI0028ADD566|nr:hypothetical protein [Actinomadura alba]
MSPRSRRRPPGDAKPPSDEIYAIFDDILKHARELLAVRSPLDAELIVSEILGSWWGRRSGEGGADADEVVGEALVDHAGRAGTPAALALLTGMAYLGTSRQAAMAERAALGLMERGVARPGWAGRVGMVAAEDCYASRDVYGDRESIVCTFTYGGAERHALIVSVDHNYGGMVRDAWVSSQVGKVLDHCRSDGRDNPLMRFEELEPGRVRALLETALRATDGWIDPPVNEGFGSYNAFVRARVRALPPGGRHPAPPVYGRDRRATLAAQFLASDEAEELSDRSAASRCVDRIIDYGCTYDSGRPLRVSPIKCERFLLEWVPSKVLLWPNEQEAMPHVLAAWVRWASKRTGLPEEGVRATLDAVWDATVRFADVYRDPTEAGLDRDIVERLLPDGDLEALPRRAFALPFLNGRHGNVDLTSLNPVDPADRRRLLEFEHPGAPEEHLAEHERLAVRLWAGDPPQLWHTAQNLLDLGYERHEILHRLIEVIDRHGDDAEALRDALRALRHDRPPSAD